MKIYFAGIPAGYKDFKSWRETEKILHNEMKIDNRLCSYYFMDILKGYMEFRKSYERFLFKKKIRTSREKKNSKK